MHWLINNGKNLLKNLHLQNQKANDLEIGMKHLRCGPYQVSSNDDPNLTYYMARSNLFES